MEIKVFKFGGASVNSAQGVRNVASILRKYTKDHILMVVSAMGKTTNALEEVLRHYLADDPVSLVDAYNRLRNYHFTILEELFKNHDHPVYGEVGHLFDRLRGHIRRGHLISGKKGDYDFEYDQVVCFGELISASVIYHFLNLSKIECTLFDARELIKTNTVYRDARVDWDVTLSAVRSKIHPFFSPGNKKRKIAITHGFIGSDPSGNTTTLGREGSDYTAAIFAFALKTKEVTIWKDVPGVMNADPKWFRNAKKIDLLSYREAIELAYFGASVIHPKTIKPLENANITLKVKSFLDPGMQGTSVKNLKEWTVPFPIYILKKDQVLISISPRDFSFIVEENLSQIFDILARHRVKVNVMQNSAISFSVCVDANHHSITSLLADLKENYTLRYNDNLELYTIRHYNQAAINRITRNREVYLEQKTRSTVHLVVTVSPPGNRI